MLQGDIYNLQGSTPQLQGGYNPQGFTGPVLQGQPAPVAPAPKPVQPKAAPRTVAPTPAPAAPAQEFKLADGNVYDVNGNMIRRESPQLPTATVPTATAPTITPEQQLAQAAGQAGLSVDDYLKLYAGKGAVTPEEQSAIRSGLGIDQLEQSVFTPPSKSTSQLYTDAYTSAGLSDIKAKFQELQSKIAQVTEEKNKRISVVSENPFLSEASRVGRVRRDSDYFDNQIANLSSQAQNVLELYNQGLTEVNNLVSRQTQDFSDNHGLNVSKLDYLLKKADQQVQDLQAKKKGAVDTFLPEFLSAKLRSQKPETIGNSESGFYQWDPTKGEFMQITEPQTKPVSVSDSSALVNPNTGEVIFQGSRYGYRAASGGGSGSGGGSSGVLSPQAQAIINGTLSLDDLTPTVRGQIAGELASAGYQRTANINAAQRENIDGYDLLKREAEAAKAILDTGLKTGMFDSAAGKLKSAVGYGNNDFIQYRSSIDNMSSYLLKLRSGAAVTPQEFDRIKGYIPQVNDDEKTAQTKIKRFFEETETAQKNYVKRALQTEQSLQKEFTTPQPLDSLVSQFGGVINP